MVTTLVLLLPKLVSAVESLDDQVKTNADAIILTSNDSSTSILHFKAMFPAMILILLKQ